MKGVKIMISVLTYDMLNIANISDILSLHRDGYIHIEPKMKKISIIDLGMEKKDIIAFSELNFSINIFNSSFKLDQLLSLNSDAYILWGTNKELENIEYLLDKVKKLIGKRTVIGIGVGRDVLETVCRDLKEDNWKEVNGVKKHCKYKIYCMDDNNIGEFIKKRILF